MINPKSLENLKPPVKGEVRNPNGKPKGIPNAKTRYKRLLELVTTKTNPVTGVEEEFTQIELMDMAVFNKALKGDLNAYKEIMDRLEGKATQSVDIDMRVDPRKEILKKYGLGDDDAGQTEEATS